MRKLKLNVCLFFASLMFFMAFVFGVWFAVPSLQVLAEGNIVAFSGEAYKLAGASIRVFEKNGEPIQDGKTGIRFHVLMDANLYAENKDNPDFKTYTVIMPTYLLSGDLTYETKNALVLETTDVWKTHSKDVAYVESVAYVYGVPSAQYATEIAYRGVVSFDGGKTISQQTETATRSIAYVAKAARDDVNAVLTDANAEQVRVNTLNAYIPKYNLVYNVGGQKTTETVEYASVPTKAPQGVTIWKNANNENVDLNKKITENTTKEIVLTAYASIKVNASNASAKVGGVLIENGASVEMQCGTYTINVAPVTNYYISSLSVNGNAYGAVNSCSVSIMGDTTISALGSIIRYNIALDNTAGATVNGSIAGTYDINTKCSFTLGKGFYDVTIDGKTISPSANGQYVFTVTANSTLKIVRLTDAQTKSKLLNIIATYGTNLSVSGENLVSPADKGTIKIPQELFDELKKYGYTTITFDIDKPQKSELYKKRIQNVTDGKTVAEIGILKKNLSVANVSISKGTTFEAQYKSLGSWGNESVGVSWTLSNIRFS